MSELPLALQQRLRSCRTLPSIPAVVLEVLDLCQRDDVAIQEVARVLARDPALAAKVLTVANSAWYGLRSQVTTLDRALALLGINATLSLALSFSFVRGLRGSGWVRFDHQAYWRRSAIAATAARVIGRYECDATPDELFLAGLLQDIGMLALNEAIPELYDPIVAEAKGDHQKLMVLEREKLGADHAASGEWLLRNWNLPEKLQRAVAGSHQAEPGAEADYFALSVALAGRVAEIWTHPDNTAAADAREASIRLLDIPAGRFDEMLGEIARALPEVTANLDIDIGGEEEITRLLDRAREALVSLVMQAQQQVREIREQSQNDGLTGLCNRAHLDEVMAARFLEAQRMAQPLSVVFIDLDHFKSINDAYGHQAGDQVLISVADVLRNCLRSRDVVGRYGGEEFVGVLPNTPAAAATLVAERLRAAVAARRHRIGEGLDVEVTISVGCATGSPEKPFPSSKELLEAADRCLYAAKGLGRNRVVVLKDLSTAVNQD